MAVAIEFGSQGQAATVSATATITGLTFNAAASDRLIAACVALEDTSNNTISSVTIDGISAVQAVASPNTARIAEIWIAAVPTGTSGSVVVVLGTVRAETISVATHSVTGADATPTDTDATNGPSVASVAISALTIPIDGAGLATYCDGTAGSVTWTGAAETHDTNTGVSYQHSSAIITTVGTNTVTADGGDGIMALVGVAFGPSADDAADPESATVTTSTFSNTVDATKPSGTASGDLLVAFVYAQTFGANVLAPPGDWTTAEETDNISSEFEAGVYYKVAGGSEGSTYTFTATGAEEITAHVLRISGAGALQDSAESTASSSGNIVFPSVTSTTDDALILLCGFAGYASAPTVAQWSNVGPAGTAVLSKDVGVADYGMIGGIANFIKATAGATGTTSAPNGTIGTDYYAVSLAFGPASGGATAYTADLTAGSFALTGTSINVPTGRPVSLTAGSFALTGTSISVPTGRPVSLTAGSFALTGTSITVPTGRLVDLSPGALAITGSDLTVPTGRLASLTPGSFALTGSDIDGVYVDNGAPIAYAADLDPGVFVLTGSSLDIVASITPEATGGKGGFDPHYYKRRKKKKQPIQSFLDKIEAAPLGQAPEDVQAKAEAARIAAEKFLADQTDALRVRAMAKIDAFYAEIAAEIARQAEEDDEDWLLLAA